MEFLLVVLLISVLLLIAAGRSLWVWLAVLVVAVFVEHRASRVRCPSCGERVLAGRHMSFCNQCGADQAGRRGFRLRCRACRKLTRSELNMHYCNRCGARAS